MNEKSEFGKGLVICLVKFAEHFMKLQNDLETYKKMHKQNPKLFAESHAINMWANGASDHLYEIEVPEGKEWDSIRKKVLGLQKTGLDMGHGCGLMGTKKYTKEDVFKLMDLTREIALDIDKKLGLKAEIGQW